MSPSSLPVFPAWHFAGSHSEHIIIFCLCGTGGVLPQFYLHKTSALACVVALPLLSSSGHLGGPSFSFTGFSPPVFVAPVTPLFVRFVPVPGATLGLLGGFRRFSARSSPGVAAEAL